MIRVRFDSGLVLQYNEAGWIEPGAGYSDLWTSRDKTKYVAQVPNTCVIEAVEPCRIYRHDREGPTDNLSVIANLKRKLTLARKRNRELRKAVRS